MASCFQWRLLIILTLAENLLVTSSDAKPCSVYKNCNGNLRSSRDSSRHVSALHNSKRKAPPHQDSRNTSEAHVGQSSMTTLPRWTLKSEHNEIIPTHGNEWNGQNEKEKSLSPQRFPYSPKLRPNIQSNERFMSRRNQTPKVEGGQHFRIDAEKVRVKKEFFQMFPLTSPPQRSPGLTVDCRMNRCAHERSNGRQDRYERPSTVADADTSRSRTLQKVREYLLKENAMNPRKSLKAFKFGRKRKSVNAIGMDHLTWKPENQSLDRKPSAEFQLLQSAEGTKLAADPRPFNLKDFLEQDPELAQRFSRLPKDRPKFRYGKRIREVRPM